MNEYDRITKRHNEMNERFAPLKGYRVETSDGQFWEYSSCNDLGVPYFKKVVNGKAQKTEYFLCEYRRDWAEEELLKWYH
jgi:hypothetical protein